MVAIGDTVKVKDPIWHRDKQRHGQYAKVVEVFDDGRATIIRVMFSDGGKTDLIPEEYDIVKPTEPKWKVRFDVHRDKKKNPKGTVECLRNTKHGIAYGCSKCNVDAGDVFTIKQGKFLARCRAEFAHLTDSEAYFKDQSLMMSPSIALTENDLKKFRLEV
jgi:hypothetical protein